MPQIQKSFEENFEYSDSKMPEVIKILKDNLNVISPGSDFSDRSIGRFPENCTFSILSKLYTRS